MEVHVRWVVGMWVVYATGSGCTGDVAECVLSSPHCEGNTVVSCSELGDLGTDYTENREDCGAGHCMEVMLENGPLVLCVTSTVRDPSMPARDIVSRCEGEAIATYFDGYRAQPRACEFGCLDAARAAGWTCEGAADCRQASQTEDPVFDPNCGNSAWYCAGSLRIECLCGVRVGSRECGSGDRCESGCFD